MSEHVVGSSGALSAEELRLYYNFMLEAVKLSRHGFGFTPPNPCVGALLVENGKVVAQGWHARCGEEHAERAALRDAREKGVDPSVCTLVVTLEPCNHQGKTPPCTEAILEAGIKHVVVGCADPNPTAAGGAVFLRSRGVRVDMGVAEEMCRNNIADFIHWQNSATPYVILKLASTLDGRIATRSGASKWITGHEARRRVHWLRSRVQAVLVGGNTFYADNPALTCREDEYGIYAERQPLAVVLTSRLPDITSPLHLVQERIRETVFMSSVTVAASARAEALRHGGARVFGLNYVDGRVAAGAGKTELNLTEGLEKLRSELGVYHLMCEGGGKLALWLLEHGHVQELHLHMSPKILGDNEARPLFDGRSPEKMEDAIGMRFAAVESCGEDMLILLRPQRKNET